MSGNIEALLFKFGCHLCKVSMIQLTIDFSFEAMKNHFSKFAIVNLNDVDIFIANAV